MYRNRRYIFLCAVLVLMVFGPRVFAVDVSKILEQAAKEPNTLSSVFDGKAQVSNLYEKALHLAKQNEIVTTQQSLKDIVAYYGRLNPPCKITTKDVLHVLYNSNQGFRVFFRHTVIDALGDGTSKPSSEEISASYKRFLACGGTAYKTTDDYAILEADITNLYYQYLNNSFLLSTMDQSSFGEDLFRNGTLDDSDFDLLVDINALGTAFFSVFNPVPEILFYRLPESDYQGVQGFGPSGGGGSGIGGPSVNTGIGGTGGSGGTGGGIGGISNNNASIMGEALALTVSPNITEDTPTLADADVQQFLNMTNPNSFVSQDFNFVVGDQCDTGAVVPVVSSGQAPASTITDEEYISGIVAFIDNANVQDAVNAQLYSGFAATYAAAVAGHTTTTTTGLDTTANAIANTYAEQAFGVGSSSCESTCLGLPMGEQMQCQLGCAKTCIQKCDGMSLYDKTLCVSDCACFLISGPNGPGWEKMEAMFSVKFCKGPIEQKSFERGRVVTSIQGIIDEIEAILTSLKTSGETTKKEKPKEFLDPNIKLKFSEIFDFKILVTFKSLFPQASDTAKTRQQTVENKKLTNALLGIGSDTSSENYNKYVIVQDIPRTNAEKQKYNTPADLENLVAIFTTAQNSADASLTGPITLYQNQKMAFLSEDFITFLNSHNLFRNQILSMLQGILEDAVTLKKNIEKSN